MDKAEIVKLREFLRHSFGAPMLQVAPNSKSAEAADVLLGERRLGTLTVDDEDGDRSFAFEMKVPVGRAVLQDYLRRLFENDKLTIAGRLKKADSVELSNGPDFLGVISADNEISIRLHEQFGFDITGRLPEVGRKFERWLDLVLMQKMLQRLAD